METIGTTPKIILDFFVLTVIHRQATIRQRTLEGRPMVANRLESGRTERCSGFDSCTFRLESLLSGIRVKL